MNLFKYQNVKSLLNKNFTFYFPSLNQKKLQNILPPQIRIEDLPSKIAVNVITSSSEPIPECLTCGGYL